VRHIGIARQATPSFLHANRFASAAPEESILASAIVLASVKGGLSPRKISQAHQSTEREDTPKATHHIRAAAIATDYGLVDLSLPREPIHGHAVYQRTAIRDGVEGVAT